MPHRRRRESRSPRYSPSISPVREHDMRDSRSYRSLHHIRARDNVRRGHVYWAHGGGARVPTG